MNLLAALAGFITGATANGGTRGCLRGCGCLLIAGLAVMIAIPLLATALIRAIGG